MTNKRYLLKEKYKYMYPYTRQQMIKWQFTGESYNFLFFLEQYLNAAWVVEVNVCDIF